MEKTYCMCYAIASQCNQTFQVVLRHGQIELVDPSSFVTVQWHWKAMGAFLLNNKDKSPFLYQTLTNKPLESCEDSSEPNGLLHVAPTRILLAKKGKKKRVTHQQFAIMQSTC